MPAGASGDGENRLGCWRGGIVLIRVSFRFFETESIAAITILISKYRIEIKEEPEFAGETFEERFARVTDFTLGLTNA